MLSEVVQPEDVGDDFKAGDTVYCALHGKGTVAKTLKGGRVYSVAVKFIANGKSVSEIYTKNGKPYQSSERTLFFTPTSINKGSIKRPFVPKLEGRTFYFKFVIGKSFVATVQTETEDSLWLCKISDDPERLYYSTCIPKSRIQSMREVGEEIKP